MDYEIGQRRMPEVPNFRHPGSLALRSSIGAALAPAQDMKEMSAMNTEAKKRVVVEFFVTSPDNRPLVEDLVDGESLTVNLRRARVTSRDARYQLEVSGAADEVDAFIRRRMDALTVA